MHKMFWAQPSYGSIGQEKAIQLMAAHFATGDFRRTSGVTTMIMMMQHLNWTQLEVRRNNASAVMMYRVVYNLAD